VTRPTAQRPPPLHPRSVNQIWASVPVAIPNGTLPRARPRLNSMMRPRGVIRPIAGCLPWSVNHTSPAGVAVSVAGTLPGCRPRSNVVMLPWGLRRPIAQRPRPMHP
jgi:hypothetical protein